MTIETLKNLPSLEAQTQPITDAVKNFYANTLAGGSGPDGTYLITDFFGTAAGVPAADVLPQVNTILAARVADGTLTTLNAVYANMLGTVNGTFGDPVTGPVVIPSGPGAGSYTDAEDDMATLIPLAQAAISAAATAMGTDTTTLNTAFTDMATQATQEAVNQGKASINFADLVAGDQTSVLALITGIPGLGTDVAVGQAAQFFEDIVDIGSASGQAIVGAMREGRNQVQLAEAGINGYDIVPDEPETPPPAAPLLASSYTAAEAQALS
jgi:hypothetical protein